MRSGHNQQIVSELEKAKLEIKILKDTITSDNEDAEKMFNDLTAENNKLKLQIENLLKCDECDEIFKDKTIMKTHILKNHSAQKMKYIIARQKNMATKAMNSGY